MLHRDPGYLYDSGGLGEKRAYGRNIVAVRIYCRTTRRKQAITLVLNFGNLRCTKKVRWRGHDVCTLRERLPGTAIRKGAVHYTLGISSQALDLILSVPSKPRPT